ncbi:MAG: NAD(+) synthase [Oscillospiraceae bacterium]|nr:NAD(+) synthase [Oscillospiraceae bacterium]
MKYGYVRTAAATVDIKVADTAYNSENIIRAVREAAANKAKLIALPELCITGYTAGDLFMQKNLIKSALDALKIIANSTAELDIISIIGLPLAKGAGLYNTAAVVFKGEVLGFVPKSNIPNYGEFYEARHFSPGCGKISYVDFFGKQVPFGTNLLFCDEEMEDFTFAVEICEDLWTADPPSVRHALAGALMIVNISASNETIAKREYRSMLVKSQSARLFCGYIYSSAGEGESTTDLVFSGDNIIAENGSITARATPFTNSIIYSETDVEKLRGERIRSNTYTGNDENYLRIYFKTDKTPTPLTRKISKTPFVPENSADRRIRCEEILTIQSLGLKKRIKHSGAKSAVIGVSGGLDSTLALLVTARAFDSLKRSRSDIIAVTMPCFGTTGRTYKNAVNFASSLGVTLREINIEKAVTGHFEDIGHDINLLDVTYENSQARERTQVLMDIANQTGGLVVGTGDMSELALGWATYNGDHMSMYAVNASVPKTLIRYLVDYEAERTDNEILRTTLTDILDTPVSPELLPPKDGVISQKTENLVGPYSLHDFFLYYMVRFGFSPSKIFYLAQKAFDGEYDKEFILSWLKVFYRRFFSQQFKRSCIPDGPKVGTVTLSPRGDWRMPSDASAQLWLDEIERL